MDKRIFAAGIAMLVVGVSVSLYLNNTMPVARGNGTEQEAALLLDTQATYRQVITLFGYVAGFGFLLTLISVGLKRKKGGAGKTVTQKPAETYHLCKILKNVSLCAGCLPISFANIFCTITFPFFK